MKITDLGRAQELVEEREELVTHIERLEATDNCEIAYMCKDFEFHELMLTESQFAEVRGFLISYMRASLAEVDAELTALGVES